jgi:hypothetical protein
VIALPAPLYAQAEPEHVTKVTPADQMVVTSLVAADGRAR